MFLRLCQEIKRKCRLIRNEIHVIIKMEGGMGVYGIAVLIFFFRAVFRYMILLCDVAVSFRLAVCGFSCFWLTVFGKRRSFSSLWYCSFALSCLMQVNILKT